jgi:hypothetical protein
MGIAEKVEFALRSKKPSGARSLSFIYYRKTRRSFMPDDVTDVNVGLLAPDFGLESDGGAIVRLSEYRGRAHVVLYFMREFT